MKTAKIIQMLDSANNNISPEISLDSIYYEVTEDNGATYYRSPIYTDLLVYAGSNTVEDTSYFSMVSIKEVKYGDTSLKTLTIKDVAYEGKLANTTDVINVSSYVGQEIGKFNSTIGTINNNISNINDTITTINTNITNLTSYVFTNTDNDDSSPIDITSAMNTGEYGVDGDGNYYIQYSLSNKIVTKQFQHDLTSDVNNLNSGLNIANTSINRNNSSINRINSSIDKINSSIDSVNTSIGLLTHNFIYISNDTRDISIGTDTSLNSFKMSAGSNDTSSYISVLPSEIDISVGAKNKINITNSSVNFITEDVDFTGAKNTISIIDGGIIFTENNNKNTPLLIINSKLNFQEEKLIATKWIKLNGITFSIQNKNTEIEINDEGIINGLYKLNELAYFNNWYISSIHGKISGYDPKDIFLKDIFLNQNYSGTNGINDTTSGYGENIYTTLYIYRPAIKNGKNISSFNNTDTSITNVEGNYENLVFDSSISEKYLLCDGCQANGWYAYNHIYTYINTAGQEKIENTIYSSIPAPIDVSISNLYSGDNINIGVIWGATPKFKIDPTYTNTIYCMYVYKFSKGKIIAGPFRLYYGISNTFNDLKNITSGINITSDILNSSVFTQINNLHNNLERMALTPASEKFTTENMNKNLFISDATDLFTFNFH